MSEDARCDARYIDEVASRLKDRTGALLGVLRSVQDDFGFIPPNAVPAIAERLAVDEEVVSSFVDFFDAFTAEPVGRCVVEVCDGTACHGLGASGIMDSLEAMLGICDGQTTPDGGITLRRVRCVGSCGKAPVVLTSAGKTYGKVRVSRLGDIVRDARRCSE